MSLVNNVGSTDKLIRLVVGAALVVSGLLGAGLTSTFGILSVIVGTILLATGLLNFCPIFKILGINSNSTTS